MDFSKMSCKEIEKFIGVLDEDSKFSYIEILEQDSRKSVNKLATKLVKMQEKMSIRD